MIYPTPEDLIEYLEAHPYRWKGAFAPSSRQVEDGADPRARCCLGHYADMCGIDYDPEQAVFKSAEYENDEEAPALLPADHWLFTDEEDDAPFLQSHLTFINDGGNADDFEFVIKRLRQFIEEKS